MGGVSTEEMSGEDSSFQIPAQCWACVRSVKSASPLRDGHSLDLGGAEGFAT